MDSYLFLDIDGVLNSERTVHAHQRLIHAGRVKHDMLVGKPVDPLWDATAVGMLKASHADIGFKIVISSTWRVLMSRDAFHTIFDSYGWDTRGIIVGSTDQENGKRGLQIERWLQQSGNSKARYCILDDDDDMLPTQQESFVKVSYREGLSYTDIERLYAIFGVELRGI